MKIATYNITHKFSRITKKEQEWEIRKNFAVKVMKKINADIFCIQEDLPDQLQLIRKKLGYGAITLSSEGQEGNSILYKKNKVKILSHGKFYLSKTPEKPSKFKDAPFIKHCSWAKISCEGKRFFVFNTHFPVPVKNEIRVKCAMVIKKKIKEIAEGNNFIFCGDLNTWPRNYFYKALGKDFIDTFLIKKQKISNTRLPWGKMDLNERIDYIFISKNLKKSFRSYKTVRDRIKHKGILCSPSDHCPVLIEINLAA
jgi:endonuclease/exonuclease/phosphatase family metal-dependent hydrolase